MAERIGGIIQVQLNGNLYKAKGNWTYNLGQNKREGKIGADGLVHGYTEQAQVPFIEGEFTDSSALSLSALLGVTNATVTLSLGNGKIIALREAWYASDGNVQTDEGNIAVRFEGIAAEEVAP